MTTEIKAGEWVAWCEPMDRKKMQVIAGDIQKALAWFKGKTGQDAKTICLHPSLSMLEVPEGIHVSYVGGCLAWQIWLSADENLGHEKMLPVANHGVTNMATLNSQKTKVAIIKAVVPKVTIEKRGPKQKPLPVELISQWHDEGMGSKGISTRLLKEKGISVSFRTVARILSGERMLV